MGTKAKTPATVPPPNDVAGPSGVGEASVNVAGKTVPLNSEPGSELVTDCVHFTEGALSEAEIKTKWCLSDQEWSAFATNEELRSAVRTEHERRIFSGEYARERAQRHFAKAPDILNRLLTDDQVPARHRIEAARELRQAATNGPDIEPGPKEKFTITINLGADETLVKEVYDRPALRQPPDDGEPS